MQNRMPVHIKVYNIIQQGTEKERIEFYTTGEYFQKDEAIYLSYEEEHDFGRVQSLLKISEDEALLMRSGAVKMRQRFQTDQSTTTNYETPFGTMRLTTRTKSLTWSTNEKQKHGTLKLEYDLDLGHEKHVHTLTIEYKEEKE